MSTVIATVVALATWLDLDRSSLLVVITGLDAIVQDANSNIPGFIGIPALFGSLGSLAFICGITGGKLGKNERRQFVVASILTLPWGIAAVWIVIRPVVAYFREGVVGGVLVLLAALFAVGFVALAGAVYGIDLVSRTSTKRRKRARGF